MYDFFAEEVDAHKEAWAYQRLYSLQGSLIPHSYGFFDVILPSTDLVYVHVMEFVGYKRLVDKLPELELKEYDSCNATLAPNDEPAPPIALVS